MNKPCFPRQSAPAEDIRKIVTQLGYPSHWHWCWDNYKPTIVALSKERGLKRHLEIGAGRDPLFLPDEAAKADFDVTLNDISSHELSLAPDGYAKIKCDVASAEAPTILGENRYDLAYCRMVMEHVPDVPAMWKNLHAVLAPGGMALSFFPTLYAPPFLMNHLMPERLSRFLLEAVFPERRPDGGDPKFLTHYNYCFSDERKMLPMLREAGFSDAVILPFWGYAYFWKFPGIKQIDAAFNRLAARHDWRTVSSFAYVIAIK